MNDSARNAASYGAAGHLNGSAGMRIPTTPSRQAFQRGMDPRAALRAIQVEGHLVETRHRLRRELGAERHDQRVVAEVSGCGDDRPVVEVERLCFRVTELDAFPLQSVQRPRNWLGRRAPTICHNSDGWYTCSAARSTSTTRWSAGRRRRSSRAATTPPAPPPRTTVRPGGHHRPPGGALPAAGHSYICRIALAKPASSNSFSEKITLPSGPTRTLHGTQPLVSARNSRPVAVGDHWEFEPELLLPGSTGLLRLECADVDDLEPVAREPLMQSDDGRTLLPTALSGRLPEDEEQA